MKNKSSDKDKISVLFQNEKSFFRPRKYVFNFDYVKVCPTCRKFNVSNEVECFYNDGTTFVYVCPVCGERQRLRKGKLVYFKALKIMTVKVVVGSILMFAGVYGFDRFLIFVRGLLGL